MNWRKTSGITLDIRIGVGVIAAETVAPGIRNSPRFAV